MRSPSAGRLFAGCAAVVIVGFLLGGTGALEYIPGLAHITEASRSKTSSPSAIPGEDGEQLVMVYYGASGCVWCARSETHELLRRAASALRETAEDEAIGFVAIGVAADRDLDAGLDHLRLLGIFEQVVSGYGQASVGAIDMFQRVMPRIPGTPTVAVLRRRLSVVDGLVSSTDARLVAFKSGLDQLGPWVHSGAPVRSGERRSSGSPQYDTDAQGERRPSTQY